MQAFLAAAAQAYLNSAESKTHHALKLSSKIPEVEVPHPTPNFDHFLQQTEDEEQEHDHDNLPGAKMLDWLNHEMMIQRSIYTGFYSGLYTTSHKN